MLLTVIIPFFNACKKSRELFETLKTFNYVDVEIILVNDGSNSEETEELNKICNKEFSKNFQIIHQSNRGPGAARNTGLFEAKGEYVWFVNADDNVESEVIQIVRDLRQRNYDFIDFSIEKNGKISNSMTLKSGEYLNVKKQDFYFEIGRIVTKVIRRDFLTKNAIFFPENCIYEDNYVSFILYYFANDFFVSSAVGYHHNTSQLSVTRTYSEVIIPNYYDRLFTSFEAFKELYYVIEGTRKERLLEKFTGTFLLVTTRHLINKGRVEDALTLVDAYFYCIKTVAGLANIHDIYDDVRQKLDEQFPELNYHVCVEGAGSEKSLEKFKKARDEHWSRKIVFPKYNLDKNKKLYIHIGSHKTGTTTIQSYLRKNQEKLLCERVKYIEAGKSLKNIRYLNTIDDEEIACIRNDILKITENSPGMDRFIISWEGFCGDYLDGYRNSENLSKILNLIFSPLFEVKIILYLREQSSFIESIFTQEVHAGTSVSFEEFMKTINIDDFSWMRLVKAYESEFGKDNIILRGYHKSNGSFLLKEFLSLLGCDNYLGDIDTVNHNVGYNKGEMEFAQLVNKYLDDDSRKTLRFIMQSSCEIKPYSYFNNCERDKIEQIYRSENENLFAEYNIDNSTFYTRQEVVDSEETALVAVARALVKLDREVKNLKSELVSTERLTSKQSKLQKNNLLQQDNESNGRKKNEVVNELKANMDKQKRLGDIFQKKSTDRIKQLEKKLRIQESEYNKVLKRISILEKNMGRSFISKMTSKIKRLI